jgi:hypothetical protein
LTVLHLLRARDQALQSGMTDGMAASYDRLEAVMNDVG